MRTQRFTSAAPALPKPCTRSLEPRGKLVEMAADGVKPDNLTFAGNGEPTSHPEFPAIVDDVIALRNRFAPSAKISVLTNASHILKPAILKLFLRLTIRC